MRNVSSGFQLEYDEGDRSSKREDEISSPHEKGAGENATPLLSSPHLRGEGALAYLALGRRVEFAPPDLRGTG